MNNRLTTFYLIRHGETDWNKKKIIQGQIDIPLNQTGEKQAKEAAKKFKDIPFEFAFSSDLLRAKRTTEIIALEQKLAVQATDRLRERNFGSLQGQPSELLLTYEKLRKVLTREEKKVIRAAPEAENDDEFAIRIITFLRETAIAYPGKSILVGTHGGVLRIILIHLGIMSYEDFENKGFINGGYIKFTSDGVDFFIEKLHGFKARQKSTSDL